MVILGYFFHGKTMTELGALLDVTQSRASQIKDEALKMLRVGLDEVYRDDEASLSAVGSASTRQRAFTESMASSRPWRERLAVGKGLSVAG